MLNERFSKEEINISLFQLHWDKALGLDGLPASFFQIFWNLLGDELAEAIKASWNFGSLLREVNNTFISLIPIQEVIFTPCVNPPFAYPHLGKSNPKAKFHITHLPSIHSARVLCIDEGIFVRDVSATHRRLRSALPSLTDSCVWCPQGCYTPHWG